MYDSIISTAASDRRRAERIHCEFPVRWAEGLGTTHDLNEYGVLFQTDRPLRCGRPLKMAISIPSKKGDGIPIHALVEATVVRVEEPMGIDDRYWVAATFSSLKLH